MGATEGFSKYQDVDLIIPIHGHQLRVPAAEFSLVPSLLNERSWEPHITRYLRLNLKPTDVFMDVGANLGYFTILCAPLVQHVIAFEPVSTTHSYCRANIFLNSLTNVDLYQYGLWSEDTIKCIRVDSSRLMAASIEKDECTSNIEPITCISIDRIIRRGELTLESLNVVKMDIEGAEVFALKGMEETIVQFRPKILMELNRPVLERFGNTVDDVFEFFRAISYKIEAFKHWEEEDHRPFESLQQLKLLCPSDSLIDVLAVDEY
jgi:FkbM family methyltransferase